MAPNRAENVKKWRFDELMAILLRQFKRLLAGKGIELTEAEIHEIARGAAEKSLDNTNVPAIRQAVVELIEESVEVLRGLNLSYGESLKTNMDDLPGWETTADFLSLANDKVNAELRISAGSSLLIGLEDSRYADYLLQTVEHGWNDPEDVDAIIAKRALSFVSGLDENAPDWLAGARQWVTNIQDH